MSKLFTMESLEENLDQDIELEVSPEEGEAAAIQQEVEAEVAEVADIESAVDNGTEAAGQMEQVEELIEDSLEEGEGLDEVAAEAVRIAVESICSKVGYPAKTMTALYATENFASASSRKANTQYALESVGEFLKNLWAKIKAALQGLWNKVKSWFQKHISSLGRLLKAFESTKGKVSSLKGTPSNEIIDAPSSLRNLFPTKGSIGLSTVETYRKSLLESNVKEFTRFLETVSSSDITGGSGLTKISQEIAKAEKNREITLGKEETPVAGGKYYNWKLKLEKEDDDGVTVYTVDMEEDHGEYTDGNDKSQLDVEGKETLKKIVNDGISKIKDEVKRVEKNANISKKVEDFMKKVDKIINEVGEVSKTARTSHRNSLRAFNLIMSKGPAMEARYMATFVTHYRGELAYISACMKNHN